LTDTETPTAVYLVQDDDELVDITTLEDETGVKTWAWGGLRSLGLSCRRRPRAAQSRSRASRTALERPTPTGAGGWLAHRWRVQRDQRRADRLAIRPLNLPGTGQPLCQDGRTHRGVHHLDAARKRREASCRSRLA
jgi:hypothetical protein